MPGRPASAPAPLDLPPETDPGRVLEVYRRRPEAHPYGIADVVQLWDRSRWWRRHDAVVGLLDLPGSPVPVLYAVAAEAPAATRALLQRLAPALPDRLVATGPVGLAACLAPGHLAVWDRAYRKMHLARPEALDPPDPRVVPLGHGDLTDLEALFASDPVAGDFFHPGLLDSGFYLGLRRDGVLAAAGGIHVHEPGHGVAAIGNVVTDPHHRRLGLGRAVVSSLAARLRASVPVVGLNVRRENAAARRLYLQLGFRTVLPYEEALLVRPPAGG